MCWIQIYGGLQSGAANVTTFLNLIIATNEVKILIVEICAPKQVDVGIPMQQKCWLITTLYTKVILQYLNPSRHRNFTTKKIR